MPDNGEVIISIRNLSRKFNSVTAVDDVDLDVIAGEFLTLLGPSGSGKTTVLRMIAGFEKPDSGTISLAGKDVSQLPPYERDVNTVFQDYALFPHMSVAENIEYGLRVKGVSKVERRAASEKALEQVRLSGYGDRKPNQLSGGQRQRVALARAIINRPSVLLLDEPLGALDLKLREQMQIELKELQKELGITFIFVTHDQEEALTMSDRIAIFNKGKIEQIASPQEIYERPRTSFVSEFVGKINKITVGGEEINIRPEFVTIFRTESTAVSQLKGRVKDVIFSGAVTRYLVEADRNPMIIANNAHDSIEVGDQVSISWAKDKEFLVK
ncbi:unannotated protein [freshwater metagenome]|uniref:Unannotated protein n=1 Tax=freshwater metagenome TaxID=449393 RepID=A0A6J7XTV3_9ZZZZ